MGARPSVLDRRNGLARGICNRLAAAGRFPGNLIPSEVQLRLSTLLSGSGYSGYPFVLGSNPVDPFGCGGNDEDLLFAQDASLPGQFGQQWKLRILPQEAALKEVASRKL